MGEKQNQFININLHTRNLDRYSMRISIFKALNEVLPLFEEELLDVGCGIMPYRNYILAHSKVKKYVGIDLANALNYDSELKPDITWDGKNLPLDDDIFDSAMATEVLEHCPDPESVLKEIYRVLKPGGLLFFTVPFLWNLHDVPNDEYRYTPFSLDRHIQNSGFNSIEIFAMGGWHASLAQMLGLWVRRSPISSRKRKILSKLALPVINFLLQKDINPGKNFKEGQMITGLYGWAKK